MPELIIGVGLLIISAYCVFLFIAYKDKQKIKTKTISLLNQYGKVVIKDKNILFEKDTNIYEILFYKIQSNHELTINSTIFWEIHTKAGSHLINQSNFLASKNPKIIILYPIATRIKRYINENEMVFINFNDVFFNMRLVKISELETMLKEIDLWKR